MKNIYKTKNLKIKKHKITNNLLELQLSPGNNDFQAGQFFMLGIPGHSEAPFTPINFPNQKNIEFLIKKTGSLTNKLFELKINDLVSMRGPFGNHFPFKQMLDKNILLIAGGCGIAPVSSAIYYFYKNYKNYNSIKLFYGVNTADEIIYKSQLKSLKDKIEILVTVSKPDKKYHGNVGFVDKLIDENTVDKNSSAIICGPPVMYDAVIKKLLCLELDPKNIYLQLERRMHCGTGHCQHCSCGDKLVCKDGPVFSYKELLTMDTRL